MKGTLAGLLVALSSLAQAEPPSGSADAASGRWDFNGTLADSSGNGLNAFLEKPDFVVGVEGQALRFDGRASAEVPDAPGLRLAPGFRLACRVRLDRFPEGNAWATVAVKGDLGHGEYCLRVDPAAEGRHLSFFVNLGQWEPRVSSREPFKLGVWYEVEAGWDGQSLWLTVNGDTARAARAGAPAATFEALRIGSFDGALDDLKISSPGGTRTSAANWPFEGDLRDGSGHGHDVAAKAAAFAPVANGQALRLGSGPFESPSAPDLQLAPGLRLDCSVLFKRVPTDATPIVLKEGEYMLRVDPKEEGGAFSFFVNLGGQWEPRVRSEVLSDSNTWYRVIAQWDGLSLSLEVNGERATLPRAGLATPGNSPVALGRLDGLLDNLRIDNPKPAVVRVTGLATESTLLRAGRSERLTGVVRNYGGAVAGCAVWLELPPGVVCETPARLDLGALLPAAARPVEWRIRAGASLSGVAKVYLALPGAAPALACKTLAILPERDPDYSARAWNPPTATNGAATYYVDGLAGDNARTGTSPGEAWRDFTPVNGRTLGPGERLLIRRGSVVNQELQVAARGRADAWAEIGAYGEGARPVIRRNRDIDDRCVLIKNPDYLRIRGLTVCNAGKGLIVYYAEEGHRGLLIEDCIAHHIEGLYRFNSSGIPEWHGRDGATGDGGGAGGFAASGGVGEDLVFRDCEMFQCYSGFRFTGKNVFIDRVLCHDNYTHNTSPHPFLTDASRAYLQNSLFDASGWHAYAGTMGIMLGWQYGLVIRNCHFLNQPDSGSHDEGGIDFEAGGEGCLIDRCTFRNNAGAAIEMLGLRSPQTRNVEIVGSRFDRNNVAHKLGPSEIFIWGESPSPEICCSTGRIRDNGYVLQPGVLFYTNQAPALTRWTLANNAEYASSEALDKALPLDNPPTVDAGREIWTDRTTVRLAGKVADDGKPKSGRLTTAWELFEGPGAVAFRSAAKPTTKADFAVAGDYRLRLKADDGELWRSARTAVHILPPGTAVARAWGFETPLDKEGWTDWDLGTKDEEVFEGRTCICVARPVRLVAGGYYVVAVKDAPDAHLLSPDALGVNIDRNGTVAIRLQNHTPATHMRLRFTTDAAPAWEAGLGQTFDVTPNDAEDRVYTLDLRGTAGWKGTLKQLRLDVAVGAPLTGTCRIDYVWVGRQR